MESSRWRGQCALPSRRREGWFWYRGNRFLGACRAFRGKKEKEREGEKTGKRGCTGDRGCQSSPLRRGAWRPHRAPRVPGVFRERACRPNPCKCPAQVLVQTTSPGAGQGVIMSRPCMQSVLRCITWPGPALALPRCAPARQDFRAPAGAQGAHRSCTPTPSRRGPKLEGQGRWQAPSTRPRGQGFLVENVEFCY